MSAYDRFLGLLVALAYALQRAKIGFLHLRAGVLLLCGICAASGAYRVWTVEFSLSDGAVITLSLLLAAVLVWAHQRQYIVFREQPALPVSAAQGLNTEEKLFLRGSGVFEVNTMARYLVEVPVVFWTTQLADHILAARVRALNFLGVGGPSEERGWWYIFLEPGHVLGVTAGYLCFGTGLRPAVRIQSEDHHLLYLSCDTREQQARLLKELQTRAEAAHQRTA